MAYSAQVVRRARERLAAAKEDRESQNRERLARVYAQEPRIRQIDLLLRRTMAQAAQAAFLSGSTGEELLQKAKEENQGLQRERAALIADRFGVGYLDERPICDICGGSGYIGTQMCRCLLSLCQEEQKKELPLLSDTHDSFAQFRLDYYSDRFDSRLGGSPRELMTRNLEYCRHYGVYFTPEAGNLLFVGGTGLGKTFLSACIARAVSERGYSVAYESSGRLFQNLEQNRFNPTEETRRESRKYTECDLLILDDLGTELTGQFVTAAFYSLLNDRLLSRKAMIISTNLNSDELSRRYSPQIASRLGGEFKRLTFMGEDIRIQKNRGIL